MPVLELEEFAALKNISRPLMALDLGEKVIGVAISDSNWLISSPLVNIENKKFTTSAAQLFNIINERNISGVLIGLPVAMDGGENKKTQSARQFGRNLMKLQPINIHFFDERFSTILAQQTLDNSDLSHDRKQELIDKIAASHILQNFFDRIEKL
jgi:putative Holliday junction resolvase